MHSNHTLARMGAGAVAGVAATVVMDAITEVLYTEHIKNVESEVSPRGSAAFVALKLMTALDLKPTERDAERAGRVLHWTIGIGSGIVAGLFADERRLSAAGAGAATSVGMLLFDEFGLAAMGAAPPSERYPWQTSLRSIVGHAAYGATIAMAYAFVRSLCRR